MTPERWQHIKALLADALEHPPAKRAAFLDEACWSDATLRAEQADDWSGALTSRRRALRYFEALMQTNPNDWQAAPRLARGYNYVGEMLLKAGDLMAALDHFRRAVAVIERALTYGSTNQPMRRQLAVSHFNIGQTYERLARRTGTPARQRSQHWRDARHAYERSVELWQEFQRQGVLPPEYASKPEETTRALARCDAALAK